MKDKDRGDGQKRKRKWDILCSTLIQWAYQETQRGLYIVKGLRTRDSCRGTQGYHPSHTIRAVQTMLMKKWEEKENTESMERRRRWRIKFKLINSLQSTLSMSTAIMRPSFIQSLPTLYYIIFSSFVYFTLLLSTLLFSFLSSSNLFLFSLHFYPDNQDTPVFLRIRGQPNSTFELDTVESSRMRWGKLL